MKILLIYINLIFIPNPQDIAQEYENQTVSIVSSLLD